MGKNTKPRKKYQPKLIAKPLGIRDAVNMEMPGYAASLVLGTEHLQEQHIYDLLSGADMVRRIAPAGHAILPVAQAMVESLAEVQHRTERTGKLGVTGDELHVLRKGIGQIMEYLRSVPNVEILRASRAALREFDRTGVLRV